MAAPTPTPQIQTHGKLARALDWVQRVVAVREALGALVAGTVLRAVLRTFTTIPHIWITPIWLAASAVVMVALLAWSRRKVPSLQIEAARTGIQGVAPSFGLEDNINLINGYYRAHNGQFMAEMEAHFQRMSAHFVAPAEREQFLFHAISTVALVGLHEDTWHVIFKSQIDLLQELNTHAMTLDQAKVYYDAAVPKNVYLYPKYTFEQWLAYLRDQTVLVQDGNVLQITIRGRDFLRYLVQEGKPTIGKIN